MPLPFFSICLKIVLAFYGKARNGHERHIRELFISISVFWRPTWSFFSWLNLQMWQVGFSCSLVEGKSPWIHANVQFWIKQKMVFELYFLSPVAFGPNCLNENEAWFEMEASFFFLTFFFFSQKWEGALNTNRCDLAAFNQELKSQTISKLFF